MDGKKAPWGCSSISSFNRPSTLGAGGKFEGFVSYSRNTRIAKFSVVCGSALRAAGGE